MTEQKWGKDPIMQYFEYAHLAPALQQISAPICLFALQMDGALPDGPEKSAGLRKLMEAKDCFVRASLPPPKREVQEEQRYPSGYEGIEGEEEKP